MRKYPDGESAWLATDQDGHIAIFLTAGDGPVPVVALDREEPLIENIEALVMAMPRSSNARMTQVINHRTQTFLALAWRGVFVFDWTDFTRYPRDQVHVYERVTRPLTPVGLAGLPLPLALAARELTFVDVRFSRARSVDIRASMETVTPVR